MQTHVSAGQNLYGWEKMTETSVSGNNKNIAVICPSFGKRCGIARYSNYVSDALSAAGYIVRKYTTLREAYGEFPIYVFQKVLVQHEYGLFDDLNPYLSAGETTSDIVVFGLLLKNNYPDSSLHVVVHSYVTHELLHSVANQQLLKAGIVPVVLNATGAHVEAINHLEHGVLTGLHDAQEGDDAKVINRLKIGTFGFLKGNRGINDLLDIVQSANAKLVAVLACDDPRARAEFQKQLDERQIVSDISYDFLEEKDVLAYIEQADCFISLQSDIAHWGTTGSVRFLMQLKKPIFVYPHRQFYDMLDGVKFITKESISRELARISDVPAYRNELATHVRDFADNNTIVAAYARLFDREAADDANPLSKFAHALGEPSHVKVVSVYALIWLPGEALVTYLEKLGLEEFAPLFEDAEESEKRLAVVSEFLVKFRSRKPDGKSIFFSLSRTIGFNDLAGSDYLPLAMMNNGVNFVRGVISLLYQREMSGIDFSVMSDFTSYEQKKYFTELLDYSTLDKPAVQAQLLSRADYLAAEERLDYAYASDLSDHMYFVADEAPVFSGWELIGLAGADLRRKAESLGFASDEVETLAPSANIQAIAQKFKTANLPAYWSEPVPRLIQHSRRHYWLTEFLHTMPELFGLQVAGSFFKRLPYRSEYDQAVSAARLGIESRIDFLMDVMEIVNRYDKFHLHGTEQDVAVWKRCALMKTSFFGEHEEIGLAESNFLLVLRILNDRKIEQLR